MRLWIKNLVLKLQAFSDRPWYPSLVGFLAGLDNLVVVIPTDGILISSVLLQRRRWMRMAFAVTLGSSLGALALGAIVEFHGLPLIQTYWPELIATKTWIWTESMFDQYGLIIVFLIAASPLMQHPAIILSALAGENLALLFAVIFIGRFLKYVFLAWVSANSPKFLSRIWGLKGELEEVGIPVPDSDSEKNKLEHRPLP